jgi:hypothetical protein
VGLNEKILLIFSAMGEERNGIVHPTFIQGNGVPCESLLIEAFSSSLLRAPDFVAAAPFEMVLVTWTFLVRARTGCLESEKNTLMAWSSACENYNRSGLVILYRWFLLKFV